jgi:hypothetical protein
MEDKALLAAGLVWALALVREGVVRLLKHQVQILVLARLVLVVWLRWVGVQVVWVLSWFALVLVRERVGMLYRLGFLLVYTSHSGKDELLRDRDRVGR